jgi:hypothetical protein
MSRRAAGFRLDALGPFSLPAAVSFLRGFAPATYEAQAIDRLSLAFVAEDGWVPTAIHIAIVRSAEKAKGLASQGAELRIGELSDAAFLTAALRGADGAFLLQPPPAPRLARRARVPGPRGPRRGRGRRRERHPSRRHVVLVWRRAASWNRSDRRAPCPRRGAEEDRRDHDHPASWLVHGAAKHQGILPHFFPPEHKLANIASRDIAAVAVRSLLSPPAPSEVVYVIGANEYSAVDQAAYLSNRLGKEVTLLNLPVAVASGAIQEGGIGAPLANLFQEMYEGATKGLLIIVPGHRVEKGTTTLEQALDPYFAK